jgi:putative SOS response-associated peptidase YedK
MAAPNGKMSQIHDRHPVIVEPEEYEKTGVE